MSYCVEGEECEEVKEALEKLSYMPLSVEKIEDTLEDLKSILTPTTRVPKVAFLVRRHLESALTDVATVRLAHFLTLILAWQGHISDALAVLREQRVFESYMRILPTEDNYERSVLQDLDALRTTLQSKLK